MTAPSADANQLANVGRVHGQEDHRWNSIPSITGSRRDPYPTYAWLREEAPVYYNASLDFWALSRFDDVLAGLHDPATYTSSKGVALEDEGPEGAAGSMIHMDPPDHTQMRKVVARRFTPRRIAELEPLVRTWASELVQRLEGPRRVRRGGRLRRPPSRHRDLGHARDPRRRARARARLDRRLPHPSRGCRSACRRRARRPRASSSGSRPRSPRLAAPSPPTIS